MQLKRLRREVRSLHAEGRPGTAVVPRGGSATLEGAEFRGRRDARVALVEYSDFQCPYCSKFANVTLPEIVKRYVETGKVLLVFRHLPLGSRHSAALQAAEASSCAGRENRFWQMHDWIFASTRTLDTRSFLAQAESMGLDRVKFEKCLHLGETRERIESDARQARQLGVSGTPAFLIGFIRNGSVEIFRRIRGAQDFLVFKVALDEALTSGG
jgi:protein-disulfide isomerase